MGARRNALAWIARCLTGPRGFLVILTVVILAGNGMGAYYTLRNTRAINDLSRQRGIDNARGVLDNCRTIESVRRDIRDTLRQIPPAGSPQAQRAALRRFHPRDCDTLPSTRLLNRLLRERDHGSQRQAPPKQP